MTIEFLAACLARLMELAGVAFLTWTLIFFLLFVFDAITGTDSLGFLGEDYVG